MSKTYYGDYMILSLKWSEGVDRLNWWGPNNNGYCYDIDNAGRYTAEQVAANPSYYDNDSTTRAVPVADVYAGKLGRITRVIFATINRPRVVFECHVCAGSIVLSPECSPVTCYTCNAYTCSICYDEGRCTKDCAEDVDGRSTTKAT